MEPYCLDPEIAQRATAGVQGGRSCEGRSHSGEGGGNGVDEGTREESHAERSMKNHLEF